MNKTINYFEIGQKVRKYRKAKNLSQEELAEKTGISITHMSHIETGNTKLSLPVFIALANALEVQADDLLSDSVSGRNKAISELEETLNACSTQQVRIITDIVKSTKEALDKYGE